MFGNDLIYGTLNDAKKISLGSFMDQMTKFFSQKTIDFTKASKFIDVEYSIPMSTGFPLHLQVNGTATMKLKAKGKMDTENFLSNYDMDISGHFVPRFVSYTEKKCRFKAPFLFVARPLNYQCR